MSPDSIVVELRPDHDEAAHFEFRPGQHLILRRESEGGELRRTYSICSVPGEAALRVGIKRIAGGKFSEWAYNSLEAGDVIEAMPPSGGFTLDLSGDSALSCLAIAAGSGITPILSHIKSILAARPDNSVTLLYGNRTSQSIMFRRELEDLKNQHMSRFALIHVLSRQSGDIDMFRGRIDETRLDQLLEGWLAADRFDCSLICGPQPMLEAARKSLKAHGLPEAAIRYELFHADPVDKVRRPEGGTKEAAAEVRLEIRIDGLQHDVSTDRQTSVLQAALNQSIDAPFSCQAGVCSTCRCRVIEGKADMLVNHALSDDEIADGYVLSCQAYALTDHLLVDFDQ